MTIESHFSVAPFIPGSPFSRFMPPPLPNLISRYSQLIYTRDSAFGQFG